MRIFGIFPLIALAQLLIGGIEASAKTCSSKTMVFDEQGKAINQITCQISKVTALGEVEQLTYSNFVFTTDQEMVYATLHAKDHAFGSQVSGTFFRSATDQPFELSLYAGKSSQTLAIGRSEITLYPDEFGMFWFPEVRVQGMTTKSEAIPTYYLTCFASGC